MDCLSLLETPALWLGGQASRLWKKAGGLRRAPLAVVAKYYCESFVM